MTLRHPRATLAVMLLCVALLGVVGLGVESRLSPTSLSVPGTASAYGQALADAHFGDSSPFAILLRGPTAAIERQGPGLVRALRRDPAATAISPWDRGAVAGLRPGPSKALVLVDFHIPLDEAMRHTVPALERTLAARIRPPLVAIQSGYASVSRGLQSESLSSTERAELIAAPLLILVLLLVFRSVVAAAIPLVLGALTVFAGRGVLVVLSSFMKIDALSLVVCTMMGLALGVDYSLLIVSRFREELESLKSEDLRRVSDERRTEQGKDAGREGRGAHEPARTREGGRKIAGNVNAPDREQRTGDRPLRDPTRSTEDAAMRRVRSRQAVALVAARRTRATAGRTTVFAGSTLFISIFLSAFLQPGSLLTSLATALVVVTAISVLIAWAALPALLALLGDQINAGRIGARHRVAAGSRVASAAEAALRRPAVAAVLIAVPLVLLATPALAFNTGAPGVNELPASSDARRSAEAIDAAVGPGWEAPFVLVAATDRGPITSSKRLALLARWQRRIGSQPDVKAVIGPAPIARAARPLRKLGERLVSGGRDGPAQLARLGPGLHHASAAVARLRSGLSRAAAGSGLLGEGSARTEQGAGLLAAGLGRAAVSGEQASTAIARLAEGSKRLADGQRKAGVASLTLALGLRSLLPSVRGNGLGRARALAAELEAAARSDPSLAPQATQARVLARTIASTRNEVKRLRGVAIDLNGGIDRLSSGGDRLKDGSRRLASAASGLETGLDRLGAGAGRLATGLGALRGGAGALQHGLGVGLHRSYPLQAGLRHAGIRVSAAAAPLTRGARQLQRSSPHLFDSGYFVLSALDGAPPTRRALAGEAVDIQRGGQAARMLVVSTEAFNTKGSREVGARLLADSEQMGRGGGLQTGLTGGAAILNDYGSATKARLPLVIGSIVLITFLMLVAILRAPLLAALAVGLNLASVAAAIGVMSLICKVPADYPLGGHPYIDTVGAAAIFGVTFGLSIDYAVFLLARMKERYDSPLAERSPALGNGPGEGLAKQGKDAGREGRGAHSSARDSTLPTEDTAMRSARHRQAISFGLEKTAGVITGAAAIMAAVFVSFAAAPIATVSQMGVGLTVAILLDATVVRIVLLPALMLLLGDRVWHVPATLDRVLPRLNVHGIDGAEAEA